MYKVDICSDICVLTGFCVVYIKINKTYKIFKIRPKIALC